MGKRIIDYDAETYTTTYHDYDAGTDVTTIGVYQDVNPYLEIAKEKRLDSEYSRKGIKNEFWHYALIPNSIITELKEKHGLDVFNRDQSKEVVKKINTDYPYLKTTAGTHA